VILLYDTSKGEKRDRSGNHGFPLSVGKESAGAHSCVDTSDCCGFKLIDKSVREVIAHLKAFLFLEYSVFEP
jgi:hypothetical protein